MALNKAQKEKYFHSTFLKEIAEEGQEKLLSSKVIVIGAGGLASSALTYLASIGVGSITIVDDDKVSLSNLPRQILYNEDEVGEYKVRAAKRRLEALNKDVKVFIYKERLNSGNAAQIIKGHDILLDCTDNFESKFLIDDTCHKLNIPFVIAGVSDYQGQVCTCLPHQSQSFKSLFSTLPINIEQKYKDEDQGVYPPVIGLISDIAVSEVVKYLLGFGSLLTDQMIVANLKTNDFKTIKFPR